MTIQVDYTQLKTRQNTRGYEIQCPKCGRWSTAILHTELGDICGKCYKALLVCLRKSTKA